MNEIDPNLPIRKRIVLAMQTETTFRGIASKAHIKTVSVLIHHLEKMGLYEQSNKPRLIVER